MPNVYETDVYRRRAAELLAPEEQQAIRLLVLTEAWAGQPCAFEPSLLRMAWRDLDIWYTVYQPLGETADDGRKITLIALLPKDAPIAVSEAEKSLIRKLVERLVGMGLAMEAKELLKKLLEIIGEHF